MTQEYDPFAWIKPEKNGLFSYCLDGQGVHVRQYAIAYDDADAWDVVAWEEKNPEKWRRLTGIADILGAEELTSAQRFGRPARLLATPAEWIDAKQEGFVILDWAADIINILGIYMAVDCATHKLRGLLEAAWTREAENRVRKFTVRR